MNMSYVSFSKNFYYLTFMQCVNCLLTSGVEERSAEEYSPSSCNLRGLSPPSSVNLFGVET